MGKSDKLSSTCTVTLLTVQTALGWNTYEDCSVPLLVCSGWSIEAYPKYIIKFKCLMSIEMVRLISICSPPCVFGSGFFHLLDPTQDSGLPSQHNKGLKLRFYYLSSMEDICI